ncbi:MAG: cysteine--tRNA ligase [Ruminococcus sp.]|nr:cysteine--tRNA ligase [Ruminococcus sp.]
MKVYNTLSKKYEELSPVVPKELKIYVCGPTVYNLIHIGNARPLCVFDVVRRFLQYSGYAVTYISNFTDVDDKIINKANAEGVSASEISEKYIAEFYKDSDGLGVKRADIYPKVTENMSDIVSFIKKLIDKGYAYESGGDVYFSALKFEGYGKLSHMPIDELVAGARIDVNDKKREPLDFALWKAAKPGEPSWESPWGNGRPGWHIECSVMSEKYAGRTLDIHGGGQDLCFPHHENEIAQSEAATGRPLANLWVHNGFINVDNAKMAKSAGNFFTVRDVAEKYGYEPIRLFQIQSAYRSPINYTPELLESCKASLERLYNCKENLENAVKSAAAGELSQNTKETVDARKQQFILDMSDDFNTANALSAVFELVTDINRLVAAGGTKADFEYALKIFGELTDVLGLLYNETKSEIPEEVIKLSEERTAAKKAKDFALADEIRGRIEALGYRVEDTRQGVKIVKQ